ncbi:MAG: sugar ABC transporter permease [Alphaproteobacteria bacterium]|nr:sugar ABC transporter permease [Alphaproteobacteria bacterium]
MTPRAERSTAAAGSSGWLDRHFKYLLLYPAIVLLLLIGLFPVLYSLMVSFQNLTMLKQDYGFQGLLNYERLINTDRFWWAILHTGVLTAIALPLELVFGLAMARLFVKDIRGKRLFLALLVLPAVLPPIVAGGIWRMLLDVSFGPINQIIGWLSGGVPASINWLIDPFYVYPTILLTEVWEWTPFMFLILLAALSNVDPSQEEAAEIDGAGPWTIFVRITLPAIWPVMIVALLIRGLDLVRTFDIVWALTKGGPGTLTETISVYMYTMGFQRFATSYTGAMAFVIIIVLSLAVMVLLRRVEIAR